MSAQAKERAQALQQRNGAVPNLVVSDGGKVIQVAPGMFWSTGPGAFDTSKPIRIMGTVAGMAWENPSTSLSVRVTGPNGTPMTYIVKGGSPNSLMRSGFTRDTIKLGDAITVDAFRGADPTGLVIGGGAKNPKVMCPQTKECGYSRPFEPGELDGEAVGSAGEAPEPEEASAPKRGRRSPASASP